MTRDWVGLALALACLGACGFRSAPLATDDGRAPDDARGEDGNTAARIDAAIDGSIDGGDADGDGVAEADDNCPTAANTDQHDEDGDAAGDACDLCPQLANVTADRDGDGVGDDCDPHPTASGDVLVELETFAGAGNLPPGWASRGAGRPEDWKRGDDVLRLVADNETRVATFDTGGARHAVEVGITVTAIGGGQSFVTALADARSDIQQYVGCGMRFDNMPGGKTRELFVFDQSRTPQFTGLKADGADPPTTGAYRLGLIMEAGLEVCVIPQGASPRAQVGNVAARGHSFIGLRARNATIEFRYVAVYRF